MIPRSMHQHFKPWGRQRKSLPCHQTMEKLFRRPLEKMLYHQERFYKKASYALVGPAETFRASQKQIASRVHWLDSAPDMEWITETPLVFFPGNMMTIWMTTYVSFQWAPKFVNHIIVIPHSDALPSDIESFALGRASFLGFLGPLAALIRLLASFTSTSESFRHSFSSVIKAAISAGVKVVAQPSFSVIRMNEASTDLMWPFRLSTSWDQGIMIW